MPNPNNKNKGISFKDYFKLVTAEIILAGFDGDEDTPSYIEVKEDYEKGLSPLECANEFVTNWKAIQESKNKSEHDTDNDKIY